MGAGAKHDLLSVSRFLDAGYAFEFNHDVGMWAGPCRMKTPEGHRIDLERRGGLIWLKWRKCVEREAVPEESVSLAEEAVDQTLDTLNAHASTAVPYSVDCPSVTFDESQFDECEIDLFQHEGR